jgi:hypothetical protein
MQPRTIIVAIALAVLPVAALAQSAAAPADAKAEARAKVREACAADVAKFCASIEKARGARRTCLEAHDKDLSAGCKAARVEREALRSKDKS